jgi:hypothetical protein
MGSGKEGAFDDVAYTVDIDVHFARNRAPMSRRKAIGGRKLSANHRASSELPLHKN